MIRVRQEVEKRVDSILPWALRFDSVDALLTSAARRAVAKEPANDPDALRRTFARGAQSRFPRQHLSTRSAAELPARSDLNASIDEAARGHWSVFGSPLPVTLDDHDWTRHPITGAVAGTAHWSRVSYMGGVGGGDVKLIWELSRHHHLLRLAQGYYLRRDDAMAETLVRLLADWIDQNPPGKGVNWTSSLEVAFRAIAWCWIWALTCDSPAWTSARMSAFLVSLWHHARHVERFDSIHHSPNTHLTGEGLGLLYVGLLFPEFARARRWAARGRDILESELPEQVFDDGMHFERATGYQRYTVEFYLHYLLLANAFVLPVSEDTRARTRAQLDASRQLRRPDGTWPVIGDEDSGDTLLLSPTDPQDQGAILAIGSGLFRDASLAALTSDAHRSAGWWLLDHDAWQSLRDQTARPRLVPNVFTDGALPRAGYFVGRDGRGTDDWWCLVDAGPHGGDRTGHAHTDLAHVEIAHGASHIVVDPGCAGYTLDPVGRDTARSESVHACVVTHGIPLAMPNGPFAWAQVAPTPVVRTGATDELWWCELAYSRGTGSLSVRHRRQVVLVRGHGVIVSDWIEGRSPLHFSTHWPLGVAVPMDGVRQNSIVIGAHAINWSVFGNALDAAGTIAPLRRSTGYARESTASLLRVAYAGASPAAIVTCFSDARRPLSISADGEAPIRVQLPDDLLGETATLVIMPGAAPALRRAGASEPSSHVVR